MKTVHCTKCGAPMVWATSAKSGKRIPIDLRIHLIPEGTNLKGCFYWLGKDPAETVAHVMTEDEARAVVEGPNVSEDGMRLVYGISHFKTCEFASEFGKGKKA